MPDTTTPLAPMTPHAAIIAFSYLRAVQAGDIEAAREFAGAEPRMAELLVDAVERIVVPVTALPGPEAGEPTTEMFVRPGGPRAGTGGNPSNLGAGRAGRTEGLACAVIDFVVQFLTDDHENVGVGQALAAHPAHVLTVQRWCQTSV